MANDVTFEAANEGSNFWENGEYVAALQSLEPGETGEFGPTVKWVFFMAPDPSDPDAVVVQEDGETPAELWQFTSTKMSPKSTARPFVEALMGRALADGEQVRPNDLIGKRMLVSLIHEKSKRDGKDRPKLKGARPFDPSKIRGKAALRTRSTQASVPETEEGADSGLPF